MRKPSATADSTPPWRRYVILRHVLPPQNSQPPQQSRARSTSPREPLSPAGGDGARAAEPLSASSLATPQPQQPTLPDQPTRSARGSHFDLMFETDAGLLTWAVDHLPPIDGPAQPALRLPLHRAAYLDYQGPVSGDRGHVRRVQAGSYRPASPAERAAAGLPPDNSGSQQVASGEHLALVCRGRDADGQTIAQLVLLDRAEDGGWELRSIIAPPR